MGKFVILKRFTGDYQFNLRAINGQAILVSECYSFKEGCKKGIKSVVLNSQNDVLVNNVGVYFPVSNTEIR